MGDSPAIKYHFVGNCKSLFTAGLCLENIHDRLDRQSTSFFHPQNLFRLFAIHHTNNVQEVLVFMNGFHQQGDIVNHVFACGTGGFAGHFLADEGMDNRLQCMTHTVIFENPLPHIGPVHAPLGINGLAAKGLVDGGNRLATRSGQFMRQGIGINNGDIPLRKQTANG